MCANKYGTVPRTCNLILKNGYARLEKGETHVEVLGPKTVTVHVTVRGVADGIDPRVVQLAVRSIVDPVDKHLE